MEPSGERKNWDGVKPPVPRLPAVFEVLVMFKKPLGAGHPELPIVAAPLTVAVTVSRVGAARLSTDCPSGSGKSMFPVRFTFPRAAGVFGPHVGSEAPPEELPPAIRRDDPRGSSS